MRVENGRLLRLISPNAAQADKPPVQRKEHFFLTHRLRGLRFLFRLKSLELHLKIPQGHLAMQQQIQG